MAMPGSGAISLGALNTEFGYGNSLVDYVYLYDRSHGYPISLGEMYNKAAQLRGSMGCYKGYAAYPNSGVTITSYSGNSRNLSRTPSLNRKFKAQNVHRWYDGTAGNTWINTLIFEVYDVTYTARPPVDYFNYYHVPGIIWLDRANATFVNSSPYSIYWYWSGITGSPYDNATYWPYGSGSPYNIYLQQW